MNCPTQNTLSDLLDGAIPFVSAWRLRHHLQQCPNCASRFAQEEQLRDQIRAIGGDVAATATLRVRVENRLQNASPVTARRLPGRKIALATALACIVAITIYLVTIAPLVRPQPAYARVVDAMGHIKTARWTTSYSVYFGRTKNTKRYQWRFITRLNPPTLISYYNDSNKPAWVLFESYHWKPLQQRNMQPDFWKKQLREQILAQIMAPDLKNQKHAVWQSQEVTLDGKRLLRYTSGDGGGMTLPPGIKMTTPGHRHILWVDPQSLRVVRSEQEDYNGVEYTRVVGHDFVYDLPFPDVKPEKGATAKRVAPPRYRD